MTAETGHNPNRAYIGQDGHIHLNGATIRNADETEFTGGTSSDPTFDTLHVTGASTLDTVVRTADTSMTAPVSDQSFHPGPMFEQVDTITWLADNIVYPSGATQVARLVASLSRHSLAVFSDDVVTDTNGGRYSSHTSKPSIEVAAEARPDGYAAYYVASAGSVGTLTAANNEPGLMSSDVSYWEWGVGAGNATPPDFGLAGGVGFTGFTISNTTGAFVFETPITAPSFNATIKPVVAGSRGSNAALASLITALAGLGLVTDSTS